VWLPTAVAVTGLTAMVYGAVQQDLRQGANDPQVQMAEDAAARLNAGVAPSAVVPVDATELTDSLRPFVMVFDRTTRLVASSATLNGQAPLFPPGVFDAVRGGQDRVTWQPAQGVRSAVVVQPWQGGFVVVGRSLRLVEERVDRIFLLIGVIWMCTLAGSALAALVGAALIRPEASVPSLES
jgi:hypothetical protein